MSPGRGLAHNAVTQVDVEAFWRLPLLSEHALQSRHRSRVVGGHDVQVIARKGLDAGAHQNRQLRDAHTLGRGVARERVPECVRFAVLNAGLRAPKLQRPAPVALARALGATSPHEETPRGDVRELQKRAHVGHAGPRQRHAAVRGGGLRLADLLIARRVVAPASSDPGLLDAHYPPPPLGQVEQRHLKDDTLGRSGARPKRDGCRAPEHSAGRLVGDHRLGDRHGVSDGHRLVVRSRRLVGVAVVGATWSSRPEFCVHLLGGDDVDEAPPRDLDGSVT